MKFKVADLAAKPLEVELEHPAVGKTGIKVTVVGPQSKQFRAAYDKYTSLPEDKRDRQADIEFFASCVVGWDAEAFGEPWAAEACTAFFSNPENEWAMKFLSPVMADHQRFFRPPQ